MRKAVSKVPVRTSLSARALTGRSKQGEGGRKTASSKAVRSKGAGSIQRICVDQKGEHARKDQDHPKARIMSATEVGCATSEAYPAPNTALPIMGTIQCTEE